MFLTGYLSSVSKFDLSCMEDEYMTAHTTPFWLVFDPKVFPLGSIQEQYLFIPYLLKSLSYDYYLLRT